MGSLILIALLAAGLTLAWRLPGWRLQRLLRREIDPAWQAILVRNIPIYGRMSADLQHQLHKLVQQFLFQKKFVGCAGLEIDDEIRVTIAGLACLLLLNRPTKVYPALHAVLVYPTAFLVPRKQVDEAGVITEARQDLLGESWGDGRVVLSWDHVQRGAGDWTDGQNVVLHEFAHQLDSESGSNNGAPYLGSQDNYRNWSEVLSRDFAHLRQDAIYGQPSVMDHYGATNPAEFFAVATETFYEKPWQMAERHPALFAELFKYYRVDPRAWVAQPVVEPWSAPGVGQWH
ncbi:MAG TPA: M90 family metallopeptidase [Telluria sp.]|nr:M90 family metallopeptidase [Telluria sp.]